ncbi:dehydrogenase [Komagataeibacter intermedius AF2]|uniref:Dehydrogenase n=1 Tax=Komagataeibacter intermedius AF2 TaxID=1458464 RepID=A0A0N0MDE7_9PROT|nr:dehydrogenase [Komagataeibacter intermedius AF2]
MQQHGADILGVAQVAQDVDQLVHVVAVNGADIIEAEFLEQRAAGHDAARVFIGLLRRAFQAAGQALGHLGGKFAQVEELARRHEAREVARHRADRRRDGHLVIVQHHDQAFGARAAMRRVVHGLVRHACRDRAIADHRDHVALAVGGVFLRAQVVGDGHAEAGGNGGRGMRRAKRVVFALAAPGEARQAARLAQGADALAPPGQDLVRIGLVADIPDHPVIGRVEHGMQRHRQFDHAQRRAKVAAGGGYGIDRLGPQFFRQLLQLLHRKVAHVMRHANPVKLRVAPKGRNRGFGLIHDVRVHYSVLALAPSVGRNQPGFRFGQPAPGSGPVRAAPAAMNGGSWHENHGDRSVIAMCYSG